MLGDDAASGADARGGGGDGAARAAALRALALDIANPLEENAGLSPGGGAFAARSARFPVARHKDFFDGHSWASGLFARADGASQESVSEAAHAYVRRVALSGPSGPMKS